MAVFWGQQKWPLHQYYKEVHPVKSGTTWEPYLLKVLSHVVSLWWSFCLPWGHHCIHISMITGIGWGLRWFSCSCLLGTASSFVFAFCVQAISKLMRRIARLLSQWRKSMPSYITDAKVGCWQTILKAKPGLEMLALWWQPKEGFC